MFKKIMVAALLFSAPTGAFADYQANDRTGAAVAIGAVSTGGVQYQKAVPSDATGTPFSASNPQTVNTVIPATSTDRGGTITTGGTAQQMMAANAVRRGWVLQNQSSAALYVSCIGTATTDYHSLQIPAGALYETSNIHAGTGACSVIGATTGQAFYAREF